MSLYNSEKMLPIEKLNLIQNNRTNFTKAGPLYCVFQIVVSGRGMGNLPVGIFLSGGENLTRSDFDHSNLFKAKNNIL